MRLRIGDTVVVIAGNDKGKTGKISRIKGTRVVVEGVNKRKKHQKAQDKKGGSIVEFDAPINISNVSYSVDGKAVKMRARLNKDGKKELYYKNDKEETSIRVVN